MDIVHVSDVHFGREDAQAVQAFNRHLADHRPDLIIISGDLTQTGRRREFLDAIAWVNALPAPVAMVPGNHDTPALNIIARLLSPFRRYRTAFGSRSASSVYGNGVLALAHLNTAHGFQRRMDWSLGKVRSRELAAAVAFFKNHQDATWKIVACHHPLIDSASTRVRGRTIGGKEALTAFAACGVNMVLSGHTHVPGLELFEHPAGAIGLISAGTLSERTREDRSSFNRLLITRQNATVVQYGIVGDEASEVRRDVIENRRGPLAG